VGRAVKEVRIKTTMSPYRENRSSQVEQSTFPRVPTKIFGIVIRLGEGMGDLLGWGKGDIG